MKRVKTTILVAFLLFGGGTVLSAVSYVLPAQFTGNVVLTAGVFAQAAVDEEPCLELHRSVGNAFYQPGENVDVVLRVESHCREPISSVGIVEQIPPGWRYISGASLTGISPALWPPPGAAGQLEFAWINPPVFPVEIRYTLETDGDQGESLHLSGYGIYFFAQGNEEQRTETTITVLEPVPFAEGEVAVEGEGAVEGEPHNIVGCCGGRRPDALTQRGGLTAFFSGDPLATGVLLICLGVIGTRIL